MGKGVKKLRSFRRTLGWQKTINGGAKGLKKLGKIFATKQKKAEEKVSGIINC